MKFNHILAGSVFLTVMGMTFSCDYLDVDEYFDDTLKYDSVFSNKRYFEAYLWGAAAQLPDESKIFGHEYAPGITAGDDIFTVMSTDIFRGSAFTLGYVTPDDLRGMNIWSDMYKIIRKANIMLSRMDECQDMTTADRRNYTGYIHFLRGYAYYHILMNCGPAILVGDQVYEILRAVADEALAQSEYILSENARDLERMSPDNPMYDRLKLTSARLEGIAADTRHVADLPSPLGRVLKHTVLSNGLDLKRVSVPFGVIGVIYEARPNVSFDVFSLCLKAGSACVLKGGSDADFSNRAIVKVIHGVLERFGVTPDVVVLLPAEREATAALLQARGYVDLLIPRGSSALIQYVRENARIPVIETGAGVCHAYFDVDGDVRKGAAIINNAKTRRVSVCNALDSVLIHASRLSDLPQLCAPLQESRVRIYADSRALTALQGHYPADLLEAATEKHFGTEFMDYKMAVKTVDSLDEALAHIARFGSGHSECIITENADATEKFLQLVDAACVYANAPTSFTDGAQFGLGAEIGISTQKLHARGPMALEEITTYKWFVQGDGQVRPK